MDPYSPIKYWTGVAESFRYTDQTGFAPVLHPDAPAWFNGLIDRLQFQAIHRALLRAEIPVGALFLDVGCGTGRWLRRYEKVGFRCIGLDLSPGMLRIARERGTTAPLIAGEAYRLPFADASFDAISDVTVVQHIPASWQLEALGEMLRVLRPGGRLILVELIRGNGPHIFPRPPRDWIQQVTSRGATLLGWFGQEFLLLDRLFVHIAQRFRKSNGSPAGANTLSPDHITHRSSCSRRIYWGIRYLIALISAWADPLTEKILPGRYATHAVLIFRK
jgi:SAM-dependent methyltransferase